MRAIVQRVSEAAVAVDGEYIAKIGQGILVLVAVKADDLEQDMDYIIKKIIGLRIFTDENDKMKIKKWRQLFQLKEDGNHYCYCFVNSFKLRCFLSYYCLGGLLSFY